MATQLVLTSADIARLQLSLLHRFSWKTEVDVTGATGPTGPAGPPGTSGLTVFPDLLIHPSPPTSGVYAYRFGATGEVWFMGPAGIPVLQAIVPGATGPVQPASFPDLLAHPTPPVSGWYAYRFAATGEVWYMGPAGIPSLQAIIP